MASATTRFKLDQSQNVSDQLGFGNGLYGQTFVPKAKNLARVDLVLIVNQVTGSGVATNLTLHAGITDPAIAATMTLVAPASPGELSRTVSYIFDPPVLLEKGTAYTIALQAPPNVSWEFAFGDPYPDGEAILYDGTPVNPPADFVFATYLVKG